MITVTIQEAGHSSIADCTKFTDLLGTKSLEYSLNQETAEFRSNI